MIKPLVASLVVLAPLVGPAEPASHPGDDDAAVRAVLDAYLEMITLPEPAPIDAGIFAPDVEAFWSDGTIHLGRDAVAAALTAGAADIARGLDSMKVAAEDVVIRREGDLAWLTCRIESKGEMKAGRGPISRSVRSTFIFEQRDKRWTMAHEHSSVPPTRK